MNQLGKILITVSLTFQAFILIKDQSLINEFNNSYEKVVQRADSVQYIPDIILLYLNQNRDAIRIGIACLLTCSVLLLIAKCAYIAIFPTTGILLQILITSNIFIDDQQYTRELLIKNLVILVCVLLWAHNNYQQVCEKKCISKGEKQKKN